MTELTHYQSTTLSDLVAAQSPILIFVSVPDERSAQQLKELHELVGEGFLINGSELFLTAKAIASGFVMFTLSQRAFDLFSNSRTQVVQ